ncbi:uncharacterized protein LOC142759574 [Rhinoderma darwinii]|uniref:uncharacterized protein LOC142759574 n=1 Tax=Rhinoderma darwinii TaxID=43563 RepID=UPI003F6725D0
MADELMRQVAQRVATEGTSWLEVFLAGDRRQEVLPAAVVGVSSGGVPSASAVRGRPRRVSRPPPRLSPSPPSATQRRAGTVRSSGAGRRRRRLLSPSPGPDVVPPTPLAGGASAVLPIRAAGSARPQAAAEAGAVISAPLVLLPGPTAFSLSQQAVVERGAGGGGLRRAETQASGTSRLGVQLLPPAGGSENDTELVSGLFLPGTGTVNERSALGGLSCGSSDLLPCRQSAEQRDLPVSLSEFSLPGAVSARRRRRRRRHGRGHRRGGHGRPRHQVERRRRSRSRSVSSSTASSSPSQSSSGASTPSRTGRRYTRSHRREHRDRHSSSLVPVPEVASACPPGGDLSVVPVSGRVDAPSEVTRTPFSGHRPEVWIVGHSFIFWAARRAEYRPLGLSLGVSSAEVHWKGIRGLRWVQLLPLIVEVSRECRGPIVLVIHVGGNDLGNVKLSELLSLIKADLGHFKQLFSDCVIVWSEVIARTHWRGARSAVAIERSRRLLNVRISRFVRSIGGVAICHLMLEGDNGDVLLSDGVHLNDIGIDIMLSGLQDEVEAGLALCGGGGRSTA